jgi:nucleoside-diphosphate-sugar epimerase
MRVLVTGADGFVGQHLVRRLVQTGHDVTAGCRPGVQLERQEDRLWLENIRVVPFELTEAETIQRAVRVPLEGVIHLAGMASVRQAREDPGGAWVINAAGTARLVDALLSTRTANGLDPIVVIVSSGEVYGSGPRVPRVESDPVRPQTPYAAS